MACCAHRRGPAPPAGSPEDTPCVIMLPTHFKLTFLPITFRKPEQILPYNAPENTSNWHFCQIRLENRNKSCAIMLPKTRQIDIFDNYVYRPFQANPMRSPSCLVQHDWSGCKMVRFRWYTLTVTFYISSNILVYSTYAPISKTTKWP